MINEKISQKISTASANTLDELLGICSQKKDAAKEVMHLNQVDLSKRPATRHGRNGEVPSPVVTELFSSPLIPIINTRKNKCGNDAKLSSFSNNGKKEIKDESITKRQEVQTIDNLRETDTYASVQQKPSSPTDVMPKSRDCTQLIELEGKFNQSDETTHGRNQFLNVIGETRVVEKRSAITKNSNYSKIRNRSISTPPQNESEIKPWKLAAKYSVTKTSLCNEILSIGRATHEVWLQAKMKQEKEKRRKQKEEKEKEERAKEERRKEAARIYEIWKQRTDETIRERRREGRKKKGALENKEKEERKRKIVEGSKVGRLWKNDQLRLSVEQRHRSQNVENESWKRKCENETENEAQKAFNAWCEKKTKKSEKEQRELLRSRKAEETQKRNEKEYREALAKEAYIIWLQMKENERRFNESLQGRIMKFDQMARRQHPVPWIPPSNVVPRQFVSTRSRRHQSAKRFSSVFYPPACRKFLEAANRSRSALR